MTKIDPKTKLKDLKATAKDLKITGYSRMNKPELLSAIAKKKQTPENGAEKDAQYSGEY